MIRPTKEATKEDVQQFWERNPLGLRASAEATGQLGTQVFFDHVERLRYTHEWYIPILVPFAEGRGKRVVEVGCGLGTDALQWGLAGADYFGLDLTLEAARLASQRFRLKDLPRRFLEADAENLPFPSESVEIVYSYGVLHHTQNTERAISEIHRILKPGGKAIVMLYHSQSIHMLRFFLMALAFYTLRFNLGVNMVHWLTRRPLQRLKAHQAYLRRETKFFMDGALARYTDGWETPISRAYSRAQARRLFQDFHTVRFKTSHIYGMADLRLLLGSSITNTVEDIIGRILGLGWHLFTYATK